MRQIFFIPDATHFEEKKFSRLFRPQSADCKTSYALQLAEKHFTALVIFQKSVLLGLKVYFWPLILISYQLTVVTVYVDKIYSHLYHKMYILFLDKGKENFSYLF
jgi:hypothetical protein